MAIRIEIVTSSRLHSESDKALRGARLAFGWLLLIATHALGVVTMTVCVLGTRWLAASGGAIVSCTYSVGPEDVFDWSAAGWVAMELLAQGAIACGVASRSLRPVRFATRFTLGACLVVLFGGLIVLRCLVALGWVKP